MTHPFQCIATVQLPGRDEYLAAACGPKVFLVNAGKGEIASEWSASSLTTATSNGNDDAAGTSERPAKKQKTSNAASHAPNIIKLTVSLSQQYIVAVTDDKVIHVFEITGHGELKALSQRCMPKRPCAIQVLPDNATIICADKFGDVYSLPLLPSDAALTQNASPGAEHVDVMKTDEATFKPSATNLTVHTERNRKALEAQMQQKNFSAKKEPLKFEHKLLLGHVSMLTDVVFATRQVDGKQRSHIITADRDEHIRISRAPPQSHVIEGYCLGHSEFVSKLCLIPGTDILVSGGGDSWLGVWDWPSFKLRRKFDIRAAVLDTIRQDAEVSGADKTDTIKKADKDVVVSGLWTAPFANAKGKQETALLVACERRPSLLIIPISRLMLKKDESMTQTRVGHSVLDVTCIGDSVVLSLDTRSAGPGRLQPMKLFQSSGNDKGAVDYERDEEMDAKLKCLTKSSTDAHADDKALDELLYGVANLRKRRGWGDDAGGTQVDPSDTKRDDNGTEAMDVEDDLTVHKP
ncbi:hypothetical protein LTR36_003039 [Oleoguttula mirabilis]|uniref:Transfer RNA methyltransferase 82 n=1 Tax=Oleoguttula mirabilis TaxID=1507867 RepID=A0AAV9JWE0_9PEZI|nr:hypothetical protein LTR36_003039 [Oleoguttula mirabilis]